MKELTLTDEQLNLQICRLTGWRKAEPRLHKQKLWVHSDGRSVPVNKLPDHLNGVEALNNMHIAERYLNKDQQQRYAQNLSYKCAFPISASARIRALSFIRTLRPFVLLDQSSVHLYIEEVKSEISGKVLSSKARAVTLADIERCNSLHDIGQCNHELVYAENIGMYDAITCACCGAGRGIA